MGKAKPAHHTAKELQAKADLHKPRGGGKAGQAERAIKIAYTCNICKVSIASMAQMKTHYEAKHPKDTLDESSYASQAEAQKKKVEEARAKGYENTGKKGPSTL
mmetsp:Transcript_1321/g.3451  ORF Transcript_1321/g.3451 Transcript_1321/m.3451 type:complete len:104 (+) Transcript_1321:74-385(+)